MSLINQMLQDLDRRGSGTPLAVESSQVRAVTARRRSMPWGLLLALLLVLVGAGLWTQLRPSRPAAPLAPLAAVPMVAKATPAPVTAVQPAPAAAPVPPPVVEPVVEPVPNPATAAPAVTPAPMPATPAPAPVVAEVAEVMAGKPEAARPAAPVPEKIQPPVRAVSKVAVAQESKPSAPAPKPSVPAAPVASTPVAAATPGVSAAVAPLAVAGNQPAAPAPVKDVQPLTQQQQGENAYRRGLRALQQGDTGDAQAALEQALAADPRHAAARQTLAGLLLDQKKPQAAVDLLQTGLRLDPAQSGMAMILARIQVEQGATGAALDTLQRGLPHAAERADYQAFLAALLQREKRHPEAIEHYRQALRLTPANGVWWMGLGISLREAGHTAEARDAFTQAASGNALSPQLRAFVEQQLQQLPAQP